MKQYIAGSTKRWTTFHGEKYFTWTNEDCRRSFYVFVFGSEEKWVLDLFCKIQLLFLRGEYNGMDISANYSYCDIFFSSES